MKSIFTKIKNQIENQKFKIGLFAVGTLMLYLGGSLLYRRILKKANRDLYHEIKLFQKIQEVRKNNQVIVYLDIDQTKRIQGERYSMDFKLMRNIIKKDRSKELQSKNPFLPPFETGIHISELGETHRLLFNKYSIYKNHVLVVSCDFESQQDKLNLNDFKQTLFVRSALNGIYYYNSGKFSGASQKHKHIQILPQQSKQLTFISLLQKYHKNLLQAKLIPQQNKIFTHEAFNFLHGIMFIKPGSTLKIQSENTYQAYEYLWENLIKRKGISYNIVGTNKFIFLIPRSKQKAFDELSINGVGFAGSLLFKNEQQYNFIQTLKPQQILAEVTFKSQNELDEIIL